MLLLHGTLTTELVMAVIECEGYTFYSNFDSGNLTRVECVPKNESGMYRLGLSVTIQVT